MGYTQEEVSLTLQYTGYRYTLLKMGSWHVHRGSLNMSTLSQLLGQATYDLLKGTLNLNMMKAIMYRSVRILIDHHLFLVFSILSWGPIVGGA